MYRTFRKLRQSSPYIASVFDALYTGTPLIPESPRHEDEYPRTNTRILEPTPEELNRMQNQFQSTPKYRKTVDHIAEALRLAHEIQDVNIEYDTFNIPKKTGGYREISAPSERLKIAQRIIKNIFEVDLEMNTHDCAFAYCKGRSSMDALLRHQSQQARWFLKLDIKHFFPSCTKALVHTSLWDIYPMPLLDARERINLWDAMDKICFKDGVLPQGAVTSPTLSNLLMVHVDHEITKALAEKDHRLTYTRYADDILISHEYQFDPNEIIALLTPILNRSCFELKTEKTRFGSASGRNWNLGLMYNQNNEITIGHMNKQKLRAALFNYLTRIAAGEQIPFSETYRLQGQLSYLRSVEPEFYEAMQTKYETKFNCHLREVFKAALNP